MFNKIHAKIISVPENICLPLNCIPPAVTCFIKYSITKVL